MEEKELKTSLKQRIFIIAIAVIMVGSIIASYAAIVISGSQQGSSDSDIEVDEEKIAEYQAEYEEKAKEFQKLTEDDYQRFVSYRGEVKAYNESSANEGGVKTRDLLTGSGDKVKDDNYLAYYIGWCADESVFDSSFDNNDNPTGFTGALDPSIGLIEGWSKGVEGMKIGGIREVTIPGELAYGDTTEICGGYNKPLKFMIMATAKEGELAELSDEMMELQMRIQYAYYGIDYDSVSGMEE